MQCKIWNRNDYRDYGRLHLWIFQCYSEIAKSGSPEMSNNLRKCYWIRKEKKSIELRMSFVHRKTRISCCCRNSWMKSISLEESRIVNEIDEIYKFWRYHVIRTKLLLFIREKYWNHDFLLSCVNNFRMTHFSCKKNRVINTTWQDIRKMYARKRWKSTQFHRHTYMTNTPLEMIGELSNECSHILLKCSV